MEFLKSPGMIYDLMRLFGYHFNKHHYLELIDNPEEYEEVHKNVLADEDINDDLVLFFHGGPSLLSFMTDMLSTNHDVSLLSEDILGDVITQLKSGDILKRLLRYYLGDEKDYGNECSPDEIYKIVSGTDIPDKIKLRLLHFCSNKDYYLDTLIAELLDKYVLIEKHFARVKHKISHAKNLLETEGAGFEVLSLADTVDTEGKKIYSSVSSMQDKLVHVATGEDYMCVIIGYGTIDNLEEMLGPRALNMFQVSRALGDQLRVNIVNKIKQRGEMNTTEIAKTFDKGLTAMFYHLSLLAEAQILLTRDKGRAVYYRVNFELFEKLADFLKDFGSKGNTWL